MRIYIVLALAIFLNALANILIKVGMLKVGQTVNFFDAISKAIGKPPIYLGIISFAFALGAYAYVLSKVNLSVAYPIMTSMGFLIVILVSKLFLNEAITSTQIVGFIFIVVGVCLVAK